MTWQETYCFQKLASAVFDFWNLENGLLSAMRVLGDMQTSLSMRVERQWSYGLDDGGMLFLVALMAC